MMALVQVERLTLREMLAECAELSITLAEFLFYSFLGLVLMTLLFVLLFCTPLGWFYLWKEWKRMKQLRNKQ